MLCLPASSSVFCWTTIDGSVKTVCGKTKTTLSEKKSLLGKEQTDSKQQITPAEKTQRLFQSAKKRFVKLELFTYTLTNLCLKGVGNK